MAAAISTTINVSFAANGNAQYSPTGVIAVPADTIATVTWQTFQAAPMPLPAFVKSSIRATGQDAGKVNFNIPPSLGDPRYVGSFVSVINNSGASATVNAEVDFSIVNPLAGQNPPVIDGGGSIRNKGTSIWVWSLIFMFAGVVTGGVIGYAASALNAGSPNPLLFAVAGLVLGFGFGYLYSRSQIKRME